MCAALLVALFITLASCQNFIGAPNGGISVPLADDGYYSGIQQFPKLRTGFGNIRVQQAVVAPTGRIPGQATMTVGSYGSGNGNLMNIGNVQLGSNSFPAGSSMNARNFPTVTQTSAGNIAGLSRGFSIPSSVISVENLRGDKTIPAGAMATGQVAFVNNNVPQNFVPSGPLGGTSSNVGIENSGNMFQGVSNLGNSPTNSITGDRSMISLEAVGRGNNFQSSNVAGTWRAENNNAPYEEAVNSQTTTPQQNVAPSGMVKVQGLELVDKAPDSASNRARTAGNTSGVKEKVSASLIQ
ncbi:hypothetical protein OESDEN_05799 [Oesophagostomum dentatum]|uniref:Uncharacterized protein n=1 Tax=Oesophagostomum dentatum TaxID=61180 RepID=A0A0B1TDT4_OESDE|nr:hypothetical protein OESDEN_05799 [Oesophagostomum dentatum]